MDRDRRDPAPRAVVPRHQPPLPALRTAPGRGDHAVRTAGAADEPACCCGSSRSTSRRRARSGTPGTIAHEGPIRALLAPGRHTDPGIRPRWWDFAQEEPQARGARDRGGADAGAARGGLAAAARRVRLRHRRHPGAVQAPVAALRRRPHLVPAQAAAAFGAGSRRHRRAGRHDAVERPKAHADTSSSSAWSPRNVHAGTMRAIAYAQSLGADDTRVVSFAFDEDEARHVRATPTARPG